MLTINVDGAVSTLTGASGLIVNTLGGADTVTLHGLTITVTVDAEGELVLYGDPGNDTLGSTEPVALEGATITIAGGGALAGTVHIVPDEAGRQADTIGEWIATHAHDAWNAVWPDHIGANRMALFSVEGVTLGEQVQELRGTNGDSDWVRRGAKYVGDRSGAASQQTSLHGQRAAEAREKDVQPKIDWNDSFSGLSTALLSGGKSSGARASQPNLAGFDHAPLEKKKPR
jgi:hypothetical protein